MNPIILNILMLGIAASAQWDMVTLDDFYDRIAIIIRKEVVTDEEIQEIVDEFELYPEYHKDRPEQSTNEV